MPSCEEDYSAVFVHAGAGYHSKPNEPVHLKACGDACKAAMVLLKNGGSAADAVEMAVRVLEDAEITNSGYGSNLSLDGTVECDAVIMEGGGLSGAVGALCHVQNPICLARAVLENARQPMSLKRVPPILLVGEGATMFAKEQNFPLVENEKLISPAARQRWERWRTELRYSQPSGSVMSPTDVKIQDGPGELMEEDIVTDTVGAICIDRWGRIAAGSSSGGIGMKHRGRVGPAALVGVGTWVRVGEDGLVVGATTSGTGEHMNNTLIASKCVDRLMGSEDDLQALKDCIELDFLGAPVVKTATTAGALGVLAVKLERSGAKYKRAHFLYGHTTDSMALASMVSWQNEPDLIMSRNKRTPKVALGGKVIPFRARK
ncbi:nucleophile aminohydrolase [Terfezia claveryi]|nr:nucleophile aminohydrolase [Terfezia claveryi]